MANKPLRTMMQFGTQRIGLTGGIGSGKSTVAARLKALGAVVVDADAISRQLTSRQGLAMDVIAKRFGGEYQQTDGSLNRALMRELVFHHGDRRIDLEQILHPLIQNEMQSQFEAAQNCGAKSVIFDLPLLTESQAWRENLDKIIVVDCSIETQVLRVLSRDAEDPNNPQPMTRDLILKIIASQASREARLKLADVIILNDNITRQQLSAEINQVAKQLDLS